MGKKLTNKIKQRTKSDWSIPRRAFERHRRSEMRGSGRTRVEPDRTLTTPIWCVAQMRWLKEKILQPGTSVLLNEERVPFL